MFILINIECMDYMHLQNGSWLSWPSNQFYDSTTRLCRDWGGSWIGQWTYREDCFKWPTGQIFSIESMQCISKWAGEYFETSYIVKSDSSTIDICRPLSYYVNPNSIQNMELGTIDYPFRDISLVLVEIHNAHQHTGRNISIYTMEATENYLPIDSIKLLNVSRVNFDTYTQNNLNDPKNVNFVLLDVHMNISVSKSLFNLIQNTIMGDSDTSRMDEAEKSELSTHNFVIFRVHRWSVNFNHISVHSRFLNDDTYVNFVYTSFWYQKTQRFYNMYIDVKGETYWNTYMTTNVDAQNITLNMSQSESGFRYISSCAFEGEMNLAEHYYSNIYAFSDSEFPIRSGIIVISGNANATVSNVTLNEVFIRLSTAALVIGFLNNVAWVPQDDVLQYFYLDNIHSTLVDNPIGSKSGLIICLTPPGSTRKYEFLIQNSLFDKRNNDGNLIFGVLGQFIENYIISNVTVSSSQISIRGIIFYSIRNLTIDGLHFTSIANQGQFILHAIPVFAIISNLTIDENSIQASESKFLRVTGIGTVIFLSNIMIKNSNLQSSSAIQLEDTFSQITINNVVADSLSIDTDGSIIHIEIATMLQASRLSFTNISSSTSDSSNNYMMLISDMDITTSYPSAIQNITVNNWSTGITKIESLFGNMTDGNMLLIKDVVVSDYSVSSSIDLITLTTLSTYDPYAIVFSNMIFSNLEFEQGGNILNFEHLLGAPVQIIDSEFMNIVGGKINVESFTTNIANLSTSLIMSNITVSNVNAQFGSFIVLQTGATVSISDSNFANINCYEEGSVLFAGTKLTQTTIVNTIFENNTALLGSVMYIEQQSVVSCNNWTFTNNFAVEGGVIATSDNGYFKLSDCYFGNNIAIAGLIVSIYNSATESSIISSTIMSNIFTSYEQVISEISSNCNFLWFISDDFKSFLSSNTEMLNVIESSYSIKSIISNLNILQTQVYEQNQFVDAYSSTVVMNSVNITNITFTQSVIKISLSTLNVSDIIVANVDNPSNSRNSFLSCSIDSSIYIDGIDYSQSQASLMLLNNAIGKVNKLSITSADSISSLILIDESYELELNSLSIRNVSSQAESIINIKNSATFQINNATVSDIDKLIIRSSNSDISRADSLNFTNWHQGIRIIDHSHLSLNSSTFQNVGRQDVIYGGAIQTVDSNATIDNSMFEHCQAKQGGWLALLCSKDILCSYNIRNNEFINNFAEMKGGTMYYDMYRPELDNNIYSNNSAQYGDNIASYPIKIKLNNIDSDLIKLENVVSGQAYPTSLEFELVDHDGQVILTNNISTIKINSVTNNTSLDGTLVVAVQKGVAIFNELILIAKPGSKNVEFQISSDAVDDAIIDLQYNRTVKQNRIDASFRYCESGEIEINNKWEIWSSGTYSLGTSKTECKAWISNAVCLGGKQIYVNDGYFRKSNESDLVIEWIRKESCKGGFIEYSLYPVEWEQGYEGLLCSECVVNSEEKYERDSSFVCSKWPNLLINSIRIFGIMLAILIYLTYLIVINLKKTTENQTTTLMRIMTNYLQVVSTVLAFNANFPELINRLSSPASTIGSPSESFVSIEWFIHNSEINAFTPNSTIFKIFLISVLPLCLIIIYWFLWWLLYLLFNKYFNDIKRNIIVSVIVILFLLHPALTKSGLSIFQWVSVGDNDLRVKVDINMKCYSRDHLIWSALLGLPTLVIWSAGMPIIALFIMLKYKKLLDTRDIQKYLLVLYQGLKLNRFYWELLNTARKTLLLWLPVFLSTYSLNYKVLSATLIMIIILRVQQRLEPYKSSNNNKLEFNEILTGAFTIFSTMIFQDKIINEPTIDFLIFLTGKDQYP